MSFRSVKKSRKSSDSVIFAYFKASAFTAVKRHAKVLIRYEKKLPFVNLSIVGIRKGNLFGQNWYKRVRSWTGNTFLDNSGDRGLDDPDEYEETRHNNTRTFIA